MPRLVAVWSTLFCLLGRPALASAQLPFDWVGGLVESISGMYIFGSSYADLKSDALARHGLREVGFELIAGLGGGGGNGSGGGGGDAPATARCVVENAPGTCQITLPAPSSTPSPRLVASPASIQLTPGGSETLGAVFYDAAGLPASSPGRFVFQTQNPRVAIVDGDGTVTGIGVGITTISVRDTAQGATRASDDVVVEVVEDDFGSHFETDLHVGFDLTTGFRATEETLDLQASVLSIPALSIYTAYVPSWSWGEPYVGVSTGLARFWNAQAEGADDPGRVFELGGETLLYGFAVGYEWQGFFLEAGWRWRRFNGVKWKEGGETVAAPELWPRSIELDTRVLRLGYGRTF